MPLHTKLVASILVLSVLGLVLFYCVLYDSYQQSTTASQLRSLRAYSRSLGNYLSRYASDKADSLESLLSAARPLDSAEHAVLLVDETGKFHLAGGNVDWIDKQAETSLLGAIRTQDDNGALVSHSRAVVWTWAALPGTPYTLLLLHREYDATIARFIDEFGVPVFVTILIFVWLTTWTTLVLGSLFKKLNRQKDLLKEQAEKLSEAHDKALKANMAKGSFLANMSHEIRTPLTAIIGFSESLRDTSQTDSERLSVVNTIIRSGRHLLRVINDILDLSKIEADKLEVERIVSSPFELLADVKSVMGMQAREKGLSFYIEYDSPLPGRIVTDPTRLKQILLNLCSNAIKFTEKGCVRIVGRCDQAQQELCLSVIDTGIGMSPQQQARMFQRFSQADASSTRRFGGTGLGLYISRQLVELLGGSVKLQSLEGVGTRVDVTVATGPIDDSDLCDEACVQQRDVCSLVAQEPPRLGGRVLLAEDSTDNQRLVSMCIKRTGAEVDVAENGRVAVEKALAGDYDLVLMDMQMPDMDGIEATQWLRKAGYDTPIVALTANVMKEERDRYTSAGCDAFLSKPIETVIFYQILACYLPYAPTGDAGGTYGPGLEFDADLFELAEDFIESLPGRLQSMRHASEQEDWQDLADEAHKLKGIAGSFGFRGITERAAGIEQQVKQNNHGPLNAMLRELEGLCGQAIMEFRHYALSQAEA